MTAYHADSRQSARPPPKSVLSTDSNHLAVKRDNFRFGLISALWHQPALDIHTPAPSRHDSLLFQDLHQLRICQLFMMLVASNLGLTRTSTCRSRCVAGHARQSVGAVKAIVQITYASVQAFGGARTSMQLRCFITNPDQDTSN